MAINETTFENGKKGARLSPHSQFLWGVATSGYQSEGGYNGEHEPLNNWVWAERTGDVMTSGKSANFWNVYKADFQLCRQLGLNAFRLSLEWSRIQPIHHLPDPSGEPPPPFDETALHRYAEMIAQARAEGLEPIITLHHFSQPAWLGIDAWLKRETIALFLEFVRFSVSYLLRILPQEFHCEPPRYFITVNEPNMLTSNHYMYNIFPSGESSGLRTSARCLANLLETHARAYDLIHEIYAGSSYSPLVSFNNYCGDLYWTDVAWVDLFFSAHDSPEKKIKKALNEKGKKFDRDFLKANLFRHKGIRYRLGQLIKKLHYSIGNWMIEQPSFRELISFLAQQKKVPLDFIALDYYDPFVAHILRWPRWSDFEPRRRSLREWILEGIASKWWDWRLLPEGLAFFVKRASQYGLPILIAENGMAHRRLPNNTPFPRHDKMARSAFLRKHTEMVISLVEEGYPVFGYLHWSLFDNYEWGSYTPRFGLYSIDYTGGLARESVDPWGDNPSQTYAEEVEKARRRWEDKKEA